MSARTDENVYKVSYDPDRPFIMYGSGDGSIILFEDHLPNAPWESLTTVQRAVLVTRLRCFADMVEATP